MPCNDIPVGEVVNVSYVFVLGKMVHIIQIEWSEEEGFWRISARNPFKNIWEIAKLSLESPLSIPVFPDRCTPGSISVPIFIVQCDNANSVFAVESPRREKNTQLRSNNAAGDGGLQFEPEPSVISGHASGVTSGTAAASGVGTSPSYTPPHVRYPYGWLTHWRWRSDSPSRTYHHRSP
jgi:hypothetical protein